jgi:hypothetical protein
MAAVEPILSLLFDRRVCRHFVAFANKFAHSHAQRPTCAHELHESASVGVDLKTFESADRTLGQTQAKWVQRVIRTHALQHRLIDNQTA